jgi:hypothetical protein
MCSCALTKIWSQRDSVAGIGRNRTQGPQKAGHEWNRNYERSEDEDKKRAIA